MVHWRTEARNQRHRMGFNRFRRDSGYPLCSGRHFIVLPLLSESIVESNQGKFKVDSSEITKRKQFIAATKTQIQQMKDELQTPKAKGKLERDRREVRSPSSVVLCPHLSKAADAN